MNANDHTPRSTTSSTVTPTRRDALRALSALGLAGLSLHARAAADAEPGAWRRIYAPLDGSIEAGLHGRLETASIPIEGKLPAGLQGTLYRTGPARFKLGSTQYTHWFDGDGMVQAFRLQEGRASHRGQLLRTPKLIEEEAAGRFVYPGYGTAIPGTHSPRGADAVNTGNINLLAMNNGRELYTLWEGGSALQIDPDTLATMGFKAWSPETAGAPFSAHPRRAPDGTVWSFGYASGSGKLIIYEIAADGRLKRQTVLAAPQADMVHDFAITENHLVFLLMPIKLKDGAAPMGSLDRFEWKSDAPLIAWVVRKADFAVKRFELPNGGVFHIGNAWEEGGVLRLGYARYTRFLEHLHALDVTQPANTPDKLAHWVEVELNLAQGTARQIDTSLASVEFPSFDARHTGLRTDTTVLMQRRGSAGMLAVQGMDTVLALRGERMQHFRYGAGWLAEEHVFVPRAWATAEGDGWIIGTAYDTGSARTSLSVFEAARLAEGPVARMTLPYGLPLGLHGQFVAA